MTMTKEQFKVRWESNDEAGGITFNDIAECAKDWGLHSKPMTNSMHEVAYAVLKEAGTEDAELYKP